MKEIDITKIIGFCMAVIFIYVGFVFVSSDYGTHEENINFDIVVAWSQENLDITPCCATVAYYCYNEYLAANNLTKEEFPVWIP